MHLQRLSENDRTARLNVRRQHSLKPLGERLHTVLAMLNPFEDGYQFSGTIDYIAPETIKHDRPDDDMVTYFYISMSKTNPNVAKVFKQVAYKYKAFEAECVKLIKYSMRESDRRARSIEQRRLMAKLDLRSFNKILSGSSNMASTLLELADAYDIRPIVATFLDYYRELRRVAPTILAMLGATEHELLPNMRVSSPEDEVQY